MVAYPYQDVATSTAAARYRTRFCASLPALFKVYPNLLLMQSFHLHLVLPRDCELYALVLPEWPFLSQESCLFMCLIGNRISAYKRSSAELTYFWNFKLISNRGIRRPSLRPRHSQNLFVTFVLKHRTL